MPHYYVNENAQWNGDHEVHQDSCREGPAFKNRLMLGTFDSCHEALAEARKTYPSADGCAFCCPDCNTG